MKNLNEVDLSDAIRILNADPELKLILSSGVIRIKIFPVTEDDDNEEAYKQVSHKKSGYSFDFNLDDIKYSNGNYEPVPVSHLCMFEAVNLGYKVPGLTKKELTEIQKIKSDKSLMSVTLEDAISILSQEEGFGSNAVKTHKWQLRSDSILRSSQSYYRFHFADKKIYQKTDGNNDWFNVSYKCYIQAALLGYDIGV
jgi:hypothetical protein